MTYVTDHVCGKGVGTVASWQRRAVATPQCGGRFRREYNIPDRCWWLSRAFNECVCVNTWPWRSLCAVMEGEWKRVASVSNQPTMWVGVGQAPPTNILLLYRVTVYTWIYCDTTGVPLSIFKRVVVQNHPRPKETVSPITEPVVWCGRGKPWTPRCCCR